MHIEYRRTFSQFVDNYLASYFSAGIQTFRRIAGGPLVVFAGTLVNTFTRELNSGFFRGLFWLMAVVIVLYGIGYTLQPVINILLVWLRKDEFLGEEGALISIKLTPETETISITETEGTLAFNLKEIKSIQHRKDSAWILIKSDHLIHIPRHNLTRGDHDEFMQAIENILEENEQSY